MERAQVEQIRILDRTPRFGLGSEGAFVFILLAFTPREHRGSGRELNTARVSYEERRRLVQLMSELPRRKVSL